MTKIKLTKWQGLAGAAVLALGAWFLFNSMHHSPLFPGMKVARYRYRILPQPPVDQTLAPLERRTQIPRPSALDLAELATLYYQQGHLSGDLTWYDKAEEAAKHSLQILSYPNGNAKMTLAKIADAKHEFPDAIRIATEVLTQYHSPGSVAVLISSNLALGQLKEAARYADLAVDTKPEMGAYLMRALVLSAQGRDQEAAFDFQRAATVEDIGTLAESSRLRALWGRFLVAHGDYRDARDLYEEALRIVPGNHLALALYGEMELRLGHYARAQKLLMDAFTASKQMRYLVHYARARQLAGDESGAAETQALAEKLIREELGTGKFGHRLELVELLLDRGHPADVQEAVTLAQKEITVRRSAEAYYFLSKALWQAKRPEEAREPIREAIRTGVNDPRYFALAALVEQTCGNRPHAGLYHTLAMKFAPGVSVDADGLAG